MEMTGAQILMKVLKEEGVDTIFGFPGGAVIDIYDELAKTDIRHVLVRHEQGAVHAADGLLYFLLHCVCHQSAGLAVPYLAARRPRRSPHGRIGYPCRRAP